MKDIAKLMIAADLLRGAAPETDEQLRLAWLGELAGSIIHEVNQPLGAIVPNAEAALRWLNRDRPDTVAAIRCIERIRVLASRTGQTIADIRSLSSNLLVELTEQSLNSTISEALQIAELQIAAADVKVEIFFDPNRPFVRVNAALLLQVMLNLIHNAIESMCEVQDRQRILSVRTFAGPESARAEFEDNGSGLPAGVAERLFDPMYTTKKNGMGLGLAICRRVVTAHGGTIAASSNPSCGATFAVSLPRACPTGSTASTDR
jgi:two-component system, LuxR family, sensor kinase FixL